MRRVFSSSRTASSMNVVSGGPPSPGKEKGESQITNMNMGYAFVQDIHYSASITSLCF